MKRPGRRAFTLIEVVLALAVISFALIAILGLFSLGLKTNAESSDQIRAANLASLLVAVRRGTPTNTITGFALPPLNIPATNTVLVGIDGQTKHAGTPPGADVYQLEYKISSSPVSPHVAYLYLLLWWPVTLATAPTNNPSGYYELSTETTLP
jgi:type II secretory pathway pseudopilin PulG